MNPECASSSMCIGREAVCGRHRTGAISFGRWARWIRNASCQVRLRSAIAQAVAWLRACPRERAQSLPLSTANGSTPRRYRIRSSSDLNGNGELCFSS